MKRAVMEKPGKIVFEDVEKPSPLPNQVVIEVKRIGVCGSDIHVFHGNHPFMTYPVIQGHEVSGIIHEVGKNVTALEPGNIVTFTPQVVCGECYPCRHGQYHICDNLQVMGFQTGGAGQEYFAVDSDKIVPLPSDFSIDQGAMIEPLAVGVHAVSRAGDVVGKNVLVLGAGTIGNLVAQAVKALGASDVLITDVSDYKLGKAKECGLENRCNVTYEDLGDKISQVFGPDKMDLIFECVGVQPTITQAVKHARKGSSIVIVGVFGDEPRVDLGTVQNNELNVIGTLMYQRIDYEIAIELVQKRTVNLDPLITHRFDFREYLKAYETIDQSRNEYMKVMIEL